MLGSAFPPPAAKCPSGLDSPVPSHGLTRKVAAVVGSCVLGVSFFIAPTASAHETGGGSAGTTSKTLPAISNSNSTPEQRNSPKVGVADPISQESADAYQALIKKKSKDGTLTRPQVVALTARLLGDWSAFDGTYANGKIPEDFLMTMLTSPGERLRHDAAVMFDLMSVDFSEQFGRSIGITDSYRTYESQVYLKRIKPFLAAPPGYSNHGWGMALDINGPEAQFGTKERQWLLDNGWKYGWFSPTWAHADGMKPESWHFEYMGTTANAWPASEKILQRTTELTGDPTQGIFVVPAKKGQDKAESEPQSNEVAVESE